MNRRNFLGSILGLWAGSSFFARTIAEPPQILEASLTDYQMFFRDTISGYTLRAPGIKDIDSKMGEWAFISHPLEMKRAVTMDQVILCDRHGFEICRQNCEPSHILAGNTLSACQRMTCDLPTSDFEVVLRLMREMRKAAPA